jgi:hypothetical protein
MAQISKGILGAVAITLTAGAVQLASGRDLLGIRQDPSGIAEAIINRAAKADRIKADRIAGVAAPAAQARTISLRLASLPGTSVVFRVPLTQEARNGASAPSLTKSGSRKMTVACEPVVSVLTEVARQLQPGRCIT